MALPLGPVYPPQLFEDQPTIIIFDRDGYFIDPPVDLKPFTRITQIINIQNIFTQTLNHPNRSFIIVILLPRSNHQQVSQFVQKNILGYPSAELFHLFFIDGTGNNFGGAFGPRLIRNHSITSQISAQTRAICASANDLNIAYCDHHRVQHENQDDNGIANLFAEQKLDRVGLQIKYNEQLRRELQQRLFE